MYKILAIGGSKSIEYTQQASKSNSDFEVRFIKMFSNGQPKGNEFFDVSDWEYFRKCDAAMIWGTWGSTHPKRQLNPLREEFNASEERRQAYNEWLNLQMVDLCQRYNKPLFVHETATLSRLRANYIHKENYKEMVPRYYRMGLQHWTYSRTLWCNSGIDTGKRVSNFKNEFEETYDKKITINHKWKNKKNGKVYIVAGLEHDPTSNTPVDQWIIECIKQIKSVSKRKIVVKPHPLSELDYVNILKNHKDVKLLTKDDSTKLYDFDDMYAAVVDSSTSVFELLDLGIPVFCTEHSFAAPFENTNLLNIEKPIYKNSEFYANWFKQMCYTEFTASEYQSGEIFKYKKHLLDKWYNEQNKKEI